MYASHVPMINAAMRADHAVFVRGCMFAVLSIRTQVTTVPDQMAQVCDGMTGCGRENPLFGSKAAAYYWLEDKAVSVPLWRRLCALSTDTQHDAAQAILYLLEVPGLGIVKAAFIAQFMGFDVACLDSRNVKREGRDARAFASNGLTPHQLRHKVARYIKETYGRAEEYWDHWCADVAEAYGLTPEAVSELHLAILPDMYVPF